MLETKEFYDIMDFFERWGKTEIRTGSMGFHREPKESWKNRVYYSDGEVNKAFKIFHSGYMLGRSTYLNQ